LSHESILADLKTLIKRRVVTFDPKAHVNHIMGESDRAYIILHAAALEDILLGYLEDLMADLNNDERSAIFQFNGPAGTFSSRILLGQGLGLITRKQRKHFEVIKALRNASAHAHGEFGFHTRQVKAAVASFFRPKDRASVMKWDAADTREIYGVICTACTSVIGQNKAMNEEGLFRAMTAKQAARQASQKTPLTK
jgi:hypothetical protein